jgi:hypothetical protein
MSYKEFAVSECLLLNTRSDNKVRELGNACLPWQQWTETSVWFDNTGISAFHSSVVVDLWQSLSEWRLLLSERGLCSIARMSENEIEQRTLNFMLNLARVEAKSERC